MTDLNEFKTKTGDQSVWTYEGSVNAGKAEAEGGYSCSPQRADESSSSYQTRSTAHANASENK